MTCVNVTSAILCAVIFLIMPLGRYPALINIPMDMFVVATLLMLAETLTLTCAHEEKRKHRTVIKFFLRWLCRFVAFATMAALAWYFGLPSDLAKFDGLIIRPLWTLEGVSVLTYWGVNFCVAALAIAFGVTLYINQYTVQTVTARLIRIALAAVFANVFLPVFPKWPLDWYNTYNSYSISKFFTAQDLAAALDFLLFAVKVALIVRVTRKHPATTSE